MSKCTDGWGSPDPLCEEGKVNPDHWLLLEYDFQLDRLVDYFNALTDVEYRALPRVNSRRSLLGMLQASNAVRDRRAALLRPGLKPEPVGVNPREPS